ncbi:RNA-directed DNA polymerase from mobile element jockey [Nephila pilipes]|uniref:RNA-directed DNA polymerase from mobile element jockey n=1 Tax=Nephila pilipes TaxID=299642 RepID=A0A8X6U1M9_NEPPI|nr:RNA-directed DNA polymerase from mobile element jockey [Nephila pilipes]
MINSPKNLKILSWNCNSITNKYLEFTDFIKEKNPDIIALQETRLKPSLSLNIPNFTTHRTDRGTYAGGGTAILVRNSLPHHATPLQTSNIEGTAITLERRNNQSITIASVYKPPRKPLNQSELHQLIRNRRDVLVVGDLNAKHRTWNPDGANRPGMILYNFAQSNNLKICAPQQPTRISHRTNNSIIDLCISKGFDNIQSESIPALSSDHNPVIFTVHIDDLQKNSNNFFQFTNWNTFQSHLQHLLPGNPKKFSKKEIDQAIVNFNTQYNSAINSASKTKIIQDRAYTIPPPLRRKIQLKNVRPENHNN